MPRCGTKDALYVLVTHISSRIAAKEIVNLVSLDIEGTFDNAWWPALKVQLLAKGCPRNLSDMILSYLADRRIELSYTGARLSRGSSKGCVQDSIAGPTFWNVILDSLLVELEFAGGFYGRRRPGVLQAEAGTYAGGSQ